MSDAIYAPYDIQLRPSESWRERPVTIEFSTQTRTGSGSTSVTIDFDELRELRDRIDGYLNSQCGSSST